MSRKCATTNFHEDTSRFTNNTLSSDNAITSPPTDGSSDFCTPDSTSTDEASPLTTTDGNSSNIAGPAVGGVIAALLLIAGLLLVLIIVLIVTRCRKKSSHTETNKQAHLINPTFELKGIEETYTQNTASPRYHTANMVMSAASHDYSEITDTRSPRHETTRSTGEYHTLEEPSKGSAPQAMIPLVTGGDNSSGKSVSAYEIPTTTLRKEWSLVVPCHQQRTQALLLKSQNGPSDSNEKKELQMYSILEMSQSGSGDLTPKFFEESESYWSPSSNANELYEQLSRKKYREILRHHIQISEFLGSGAFGSVCKGLWQSPGGAIEVAVKTNQSKIEEENVKFLQEAAIMGQFRHPNVVKLMGVVTVGEPVMIVLELLLNGDLRNFLIEMTPKPDETVSSDTTKQLLKFCQQISCGMEYLSRKAFVHRDLAARNILVSEDKVCKISDFGMSRDLMDESYYISHGGKIPVKWTAPEAIHYKKYSTASDVWSFGCVMYEIWSLGHKPYEAYKNTETIKQVEDGVRLPPPPGCPRELYRLMMECWCPESSKRPTFAQLVEMLSQADFELLLWREEDTQIGPQVSVVGAPLEASKDLYSDLQKLYLQEHTTT